MEDKVERQQKPACMILIDFTARDETFVVCSILVVLQGLTTVISDSQRFKH